VSSMQTALTDDILRSVLHTSLRDCTITFHTERAPWVSGVHGSDSMRRSALTLLAKKLGCQIRANCMMVRSILV